MIDLPSLSRYDEHKTECHGYCLIINNRTFEENDEAYREGSEQDVERLRKLFDSLGFEVIIERESSRDGRKAYTNGMPKSSEWLAARDRDEKVWTVSWKK